MARTCQFCAEEIAEAAVICRHCGQLVLEGKLRQLAETWGSITQGRRDAEWAGLDEGEQRKLRAAVDFLRGREPAASIPPAPGQADLTERAGPREYEWTPGRVAWAIAAVVLMVVWIVYYSAGGQSPAASKVHSSPAPAYTVPIPKPEPEKIPDLNVKVTSCSEEYGYTTTKGYVKNTGEVTVHFVEVELRWFDRKGEVVDTASTYAVGSERLRPGERSNFQYPTESKQVARCGATLQDYQIAQ